MMNLSNYSGRRESAPSTIEIKNAIIARKAAAASIVLLKNDGILPLQFTQKIALFGSGAGKL